MKDREESQESRDQPAVYQFRLQGRLGSLWSEWFEGMTVTWDKSGDTLLTGTVADQAALYGLLRRVRDLGIPLLSVTVVNSRHGDHSIDADGPR